MKLFVCDLVMRLNRPDDRFFFYRQDDMKQNKEKFRRVVKYWRVRYMQASREDRMAVAMFIVVMLTYLWWAIRVL
jgi:hypothetical protein